MALALSPDNEIVFFPPAENHTMAVLEVCVEPSTLAPTVNPGEASPTKNPAVESTPTPAATPKPTPSPIAAPEPTSCSPRVGLSWLAVASMTVVVLAPFAAAI
jgi:hypothetical protein